MTRRQRLAPIFATERTAAALLDMKPSEFRRLVDAGSLPPPGPLGRWDVEQLRRVASGEAAVQAQGFDL